jgi:hypothetical protein
MNFDEKLNEALNQPKRSTHARSDALVAVKTIPSGLAAWKFVKGPIDKTIIPRYVMVAPRDAEEIQFSGGYNDDSSVLVRFSFPDLLEVQDQDLEVMEWGKITIYYAGNSAVWSPAGILTPNSEALILVPCKIESIYYRNEGSAYSDANGHTVMVIE